MAVTISDIAKQVGVSLATVSRVINNSGYVSSSTRKKVMKAIEELNYTPNGIARSLSKNETNTIGIIVPDITNSYFGEIIKGISEAAEQEDLNIILFNTDDDKDKELRALKLLKEQRIKGVIMTPAYGEEEFNSEYLNALETLNVPLVLVAAGVKYAKLNGVFVDNIRGAFDATNYLIKEGHTKIGIITGRLNSDPALDRLNGYRKALSFNNIHITDRYIFHGDYKMQTAYELTKDILSMEDPPTALLISSNMMTLGCIKAVYEEGKKIPDSLSVIGFDKLEILDVLGINISYVDDSPTDLGRGAAAMLLSIIENGGINEVREVTISPKIVLRGSEKMSSR